MKVDRDMMALLKATKKVATAPRQALERLRRSTAPVRLTSPEPAAKGETASGTERAG